MGNFGAVSSSSEVAQTTRSHTSGVTTAIPPILGQLRSLRLPKQQSCGVSIPQGPPPHPRKEPPRRGDHILAARSPGASGIAQSCDNRKGTGAHGQVTPPAPRDGARRGWRAIKPLQGKATPSASFQPQHGASGTKRLRLLLANSVPSRNQTRRICAVDVAQVLHPGSRGRPGKAQRMQICPTTTAK